LVPQWISSKYHLWLGLIGEFRRRFKAAHESTPRVAMIAACSLGTHP
jgi:hypothetical protein